MGAVRQDVRPGPPTTVREHKRKSCWSTDKNAYRKVCRSADIVIHTETRPIHTLITVGIKVAVPQDKRVLVTTESNELGDPSCRFSKCRGVG
jgi:hypothetical protein